MRIWVVVIIWLLISCNEIRDCELASSRDYAVLAFYIADSLPKKYAPDTLLVGDRPDTVPRSNNLTAFGINVDPGNIIVDDTLLLDGEPYRLWLSYSKNLEIYYDECEPVFKYVLDSVYGPDFDSVSLVAGPLDKTVGVNVEIYF